MYKKPAWYIQKQIVLKFWSVIAKASRTKILLGFEALLDLTCAVYGDKISQLEADLTT